jgi:hypothetical protein
MNERQLVIKQKWEIHRRGTLVSGLSVASSMSVKDIFLNRNIYQSTTKCSQQFDEYRKIS